MIKINFSPDPLQTKRIAYFLEKVLFLLAAVLNGFIGFEIANGPFQSVEIVTSLFISALVVIYFNSYRIQT